MDQSSQQDRESTDGPLLEVKGLCKSFEHGGRRLDVLREIDLTLNEGEMLAVVGRSGAGKSTLLHVLGTIDLPSEGSIHFRGKDLLAMSNGQLAEFRNRSIGFIFQFHHLLPEFDALENVMMPALIGRNPQQRARQMAEGILEQVGLADRMAHRPGELSGGEQQRVALARALVLEPKLLLADEPTGNLDPRTGEEIHDLLMKLNEEHSVTLILVTHNVSLADRMTRRLRLTEGRMTERADGEVVGD